MRANITSVLLLVGVSYLSVSMGAELKYVQLNTTNMAQLDSAIAAIQGCGGVVRHVFPPDVVFATLPDFAESWLTQKPAIQLIASESSELRQSSERRVQITQSVWSHLIARRDGSPADSREPRPLSNCFLKIDAPPAIQEELLRQVRGSRTAFPDRLTSNFLLGRIAVKIILVESDGGDENWWTAAEDQTIAQIVEGLNALAETAGALGARVHFVYETNFGVPTGYEPIQGDHVPHYQWFPPNWIFDWLDDAIDYFGFGEGWDGLFAMANDIRRAFHANWGYSVFVVMDENDPDHCFADGYSAYVG